jgi:hypothetical protein
MWILLILIGYVLPVILAYRYVHIMYSYNGAERYSSPDGRDAFMVFCPVLNILSSFAWLIDHPSANKLALFERYTFTWAKFFRIKHAPK